ncbi:hypothetical protein ACJIZ3_022312 [Penstemon smallii]|uniref:Uncharacterized protein n=1 Tax=Penstemon smallii TaxID=265156 RepID=A0ABD3TM76_9LAMI
MATQSQIHEYVSKFGSASLPRGDIDCMLFSRLQFLNPIVHPRLGSIDSYSIFLNGDLVCRVSFDICLILCLC